MSWRCGAGLVNEEGVSTIGMSQEDIRATGYGAALPVCMGSGARSSADALLVHRWAVVLGAEQRWRRRLARTRAS